MVKFLVVISTLVSVSFSTYADYGNRLSFSSCYIDIPDVYDLFANSEHRKVYLNVGEGSSIRFSKYELNNSKSIKLVSSEPVNGFFLEEYVLLEKIHLADGLLSKYYKIHDEKYEMSFLNMKKNNVLELANSCKSY